MAAVEGVDAVGKKTHSLLLARWLRRKGVKTALMSFPDYATPTGKEIKNFLSSRRAYPIELQHLLFAANRWEKANRIGSIIGGGGVVIADRYTQSNLAYGKANGLDVEWLASLEKGLPAADLVIILDAPSRSLSSRRPGREKDAYERSPSLQDKAQKAYRELARERGWKLIDAAGSVEDVEAAVLSTVKKAISRDRGVTL